MANRGYDTCITQLYISTPSSLRWRKLGLMPPTSPPPDHQPPDHQTSRPPLGKDAVSPDRPVPPLARRLAGRRLDSVELLGARGAAPVLAAARLQALRRAAAARLQALRRAAAARLQALRRAAAAGAAQGCGCAAAGTRTTGGVCNWFATGLPRTGCKPVWNWFGTGLKLV